MGIGKMRTWSFNFSLAVNAVLFFVQATSALLQGIVFRDYAAMKFSILMALVASVCMWITVWAEERARTRNSTLDELLKEQIADTQLREQMLEQFKELRANGQFVQMGPFSQVEH